MKEKKSITVVLPLAKTAKDFGYDLEVDTHDDVFHDGYSAREIRKQNFRIPSEYENSDLYFPYCVSQAFEDVEREAWAEAIRKERINAFEEALLKISTSTGSIEAVDVNEAEDTVSVTIINAAALINEIVEGVGMYSSPFDDLDQPVSEIASHFHNLEEYFSVYGESKPSGELSSQFSPNVNDEYLKEVLKDRLENVSLEEAAEAVIDYVEETGEEADTAEFAKLVPHLTAEAIKAKAVELNKNRTQEIESKIL